MSFIEQKRQTIIEENNTAQSDFLDFLEHLNPASSDIIVREPLSGDLDFAVLKECNFTNITSLQFTPGNITSLKNIPTGITKIICAENYLIELPDLPDSLVELDVRHNAIKRIDGVLPTGLKDLNISENLFTSLANFPTGLEVLKCNTNQLRIMDLNGIENLRVLHCSNNPLLVVEHLPDTIQDMEMDNDVVTDIQRLREPGDEKSDENNAEKRADYIECLHTYFELKAEYEKRVHDMKHVIYKKSISKKSARLKMAALKPKCINCARPVGSIFKNKGRTYIATCGDVTNPCIFNIQLFAGEYSRVSRMVNYYKDILEITKESIIIDKLQVLFNYISERDAVEVFKNNLDDYTTENTHFNMLKKEYDDLYFNEERSEKINIKMAKIEKIKERMEELYELYKADNNAEVLKDYMTIYISELVPEMENLQLIKYDTREMEEQTHSFNLVQTPWRLNQLEYTFGEYPKVIKFRVKK